MALTDFNPLQPMQPKIPDLGNSGYFSPKEGDPDYLSKDLSRTNALPWQKYFDPSVVDTNDPNSLVSRQLSRGADYYSGVQSHGVPQQASAFHTTPLTGGGMPPIAGSDAISRKYQRDVEKKLQIASAKRENDAQVEQSRTIGKAASVLGQAQQLENKNYQEQYQFQQQRLQLQNQYKMAVQQAQGSFIGNLLGTVGTIAAVA